MRLFLLDFSVLGRHAINIYKYMYVLEYMYIFQYVHLFVLTTKFGIGILLRAQVYSGSHTLQLSHFRVLKVHFNSEETH